MKIESGYDKVWQAGCRECNYLNFGCGHHEEKPTECAELSLKVDARIKELEDMLSRLVKENDLAMPNENYQWMYSPMRVECLKVLEGK